MQRTRPLSRRRLDTTLGLRVAALSILMALGGCSSRSTGQNKLAIHGDSTALGSGEGLAKIYNFFPSYDENRWWVRLAGAHKPRLTTFNAGRGGQDSSMLRNEMIADRAHRDWPTIIYDRVNDGESAEAYVANLRAAVAQLETDKFLILPQIRRAEGEEPPLEQIMVDIDRQISALWPDNTLPELEANNLRHALSSDETRLDGLHRNARGQHAEFRHIKQYTDSKGWWIASLDTQ